AEWWQWAISIPVSHNPNFDNGDCSIGQSGPVWFLGTRICQAGVPGCDWTATRSCSVPARKALFFPIMWVEDSAPEEPALRPHVVSFLDAATTHLGMDLEIGEIAITPRSPFAGKTIEKSRIRQDRGVIVLAIKREAGMRFTPAPENPIEAGDFLIAMGEPQQLRELELTAGSEPSGSRSSGSQV